MSVSVSPLVAFAAGLLSFVSPCVLPLVPAYVGYLGGQATGGTEHAPPWWRVLLHGVFFVLEFAIIFVTLGAAASGVGRLLFAYRSILTRVGGLIVVIFGLHTLGLIKIPPLYNDMRRHYRPRPELGFLSSALMGDLEEINISFCSGRDSVPARSCVDKLFISESLGFFFGAAWDG
ncbi:MAG TPA: hypothetical protein ENN19_17510 [Chloroflexi bacterium]|nr:hypothetical protein [Chloroflexota bacterium]